MSQQSACGAASARRQEHKSWGNLQGWERGRARQLCVSLENNPQGLGRGARGVHGRSCPKRTYTPPATLKAQCMLVPRRTCRQDE